MIKAMRKNEKGFTLVELVVVIAILAILALLLVPRIMGNVRDSERSKDIANARTIASEIASHNALQSTTVSPNSISTEPSAYFVKFLVIFISLSILLSFDIYFSFVANSL